MSSDATVSHTGTAQVVHRSELLLTGPIRESSRSVQHWGHAVASTRLGSDGRVTIPSLCDRPPASATGRQPLRRRRTRRRGDRRRNPATPAPAPRSRAVVVLDRGMASRRTRTRSRPRCGQARSRVLIRCRVPGRPPRSRQLETQQRQHTTLSPPPSALLQPARRGRCRTHGTGPSGDAGLFALAASAAPEEPALGEGAAVDDGAGVGAQLERTLAVWRVPGRFDGLHELTLREAPPR